MFLENLKNIAWELKNFEKNFFWKIFFFKNIKKQLDFWIFFDFSMKIPAQSAPARRFWTYRAYRKSRSIKTIPKQAFLCKNQLKTIKNKADNVDFGFLHIIITIPSPLNSQAHLYNATNLAIPTKPPKKWKKIFFIYRNYSKSKKLPFFQQISLQDPPLKRTFFLDFFRF